MIDDETDPRVGYKNPPATHQFQKGRSGNPRGRPRKTGTPKVNAVVGLHELVLDEAYRPVTAREGDKTIELPVIRAVVRALGISAIKGSRLAQLAMKEMVEDAQTKLYQDRVQTFNAVVEYKTNWQAAFGRCDGEGRARPDPVPHPDDFIVDWRTGEIHVVGPWDKHHKYQWDAMVARKRACVEEIAQLRQDLARHPEHDFIKDDIAFEQRLADMIDLFTPDEEMRRSVSFDPNERNRRIAEYIGQRARGRRRINTSKGSTGPSAVKVSEAVQRADTANENKVPNGKGRR